MKKWTVRVDDETAAAFSSFCEAHGISMHSVLTTMLTATMRIYREHGQVPVHEWPDDDTRARYTRVVEEARRLDTERRRRS